MTDEGRRLRIKGFEFGIDISGFRIKDLGVRFRFWRFRLRGKGSGLRVLGLGSRV